MSGTKSTDKQFMDSWARICDRINVKIDAQKVNQNFEDINTATNYWWKSNEDLKADHHELQLALYSGWYGTNQMKAYKLTGITVDKEPSMIKRWIRRWLGIDDYMKKTLILERINYVDYSLNLKDYALEQSVRINRLENYLDVSPKTTYEVTKYVKRNKHAPRKTKKNR